MNTILKLELPFYLSEAVVLFIRPIVPGLLGNEFPQSALEEPAFREALNRALRFTIEKTQ
jgi:hypothetical protein